MNLLHIDSSISGQASASRQLSSEIVKALVREAPGLTVVRRDLDASPIPHLDGPGFAAIRAGEAAEDAAVVQEFLDADVVVIGAPMHNFTIPSQLKTWIDRVLIAGKTFRYTEAGAQGLAGGKTVIVASARGGLYAPGTPQAADDFHETYLRTVFRFIGIEDVTIIRAEGIAYGPAQREAALNAALASVPGVVSGLAPALAA